MTNLSTTGLYYILLSIGFVGVAYAWGRSVIEFRRGKRVYRTRLILLVIMSIALCAYVVPAVLALCYFTPGCFQSWYRDIVRVFTGTILFLFGFFAALLYLTKDNDINEPI